MSDEILDRVYYLIEKEAVIIHLYIFSRILESHFPPRAYTVTDLYCSHGWERYS
jgi:hypothetical protein